MQTAPLSPDDPVAIGDFELLGRIGQGGMGQVYLGESPGGESAAVKVIKPTVVDSTARLRFAQEIEILKTVWGARVAQLLDADAEAERPWLATEYVEGPDLGRHVATHGTLPALLVMSLGATVAEGLANVHKQGLLHRDLKPANILLGPNGPKIIDFGLAVFAESSVSLTAANMVVGTPSCMPPEQASGVKPLTGAVDVYALGTVLLFAATGHLPYQANNIHVLFHMVTDPETLPDLTGVPPELAPMLGAMMAHNAHDRPSLTDIVQQCRGLVEAQGLKLAQARRRLTTYTAAPPLDFSALLPAPQNSGTAPQAPPAVDPVVARAAEERDREAVPVVVPPALAERGQDPFSTMRLDPPAPVRNPTTTHEPAPAESRSVPSQARPAAGSLRNSAQARRTAQQLREAYAARATL